MKNLLYRSFSAIGADRLALRLGPNRLRILCYHGLCEDEISGEPWVPSYFVTRSAFEFQLRYLRRHATVLPLGEAARRLRDGSLPSRAVSITFDDGYANNVRIAAPLLAQHSVPATIFLATAYVESGELYPFLKAKLVRLREPSIRLPDYKKAPLDTLIRAIEREWPRIDAALSSTVRETLRPLRVDELRRADPALVEFGAHSHTHCIPRNESDDRRKEEVRTSVRKVAAWTGRSVRLFSYPNGERGDFGRPDYEALRDEGIEAAVTGIAGANRPDSDPFELRRYPLSLHHDAWRFRAEVSGFRTMLRSVGRTEAA